MPSVFTRIIKGELPGRIVYEDGHNVAFLTIAPLRPGHTLVVPRLEIDDWMDLPPDALSAMWAASATVGRAIQSAFQPRKVAALLLGLEVPHVHVHLVPIDAEAQVDFRRADANPDPAELDSAAERIRAALA
jgi:diadenosine tetraphosphate (Ap4A) HIT family hydrolase